MHNIINNRISLLKNNVSQYITFVHIGHAFFAAALYILKAEMLFLLTIGECSYLQLSNLLDFSDVNYLKLFGRQNCLSIFVRLSGIKHSTPKP